MTRWTQSGSGLMALLSNHSSILADNFKLSFFVGREEDPKGQRKAGKASEERAEKAWQRSIPIDFPGPQEFSFLCSDTSKLEHGRTLLLSPRWEEATFHALCSSSGLA